MKSSGPYLIRHMDHHTFFEAPPVDRLFGEWRWGANFATAFTTKADAQRCLSGMRMDRHGKSRCEIVRAEEYVTEPVATGAGQ